MKKKPDVKNILKTIGLCIFTVILYSCTNKSKQQDSSLETYGFSDIGKEFICDLHENIDIISNIDDFCFANDSVYYVLSRGLIFEYDKKGYQKNVISKQGQGPGEYVDPGLLKCDGNNLYIWCRGTLKLIKYDLKGNLIKEYTNFKSAIDNFIVYNEKLVCLYVAKGDHLVEVVDLESNRIIAELGEKSQEDNMLLVKKGQQGLILNQDTLFYSKPSETYISYFNLSTMQVGHFKTLENSNFKVEKIHSAADIINGNTNKMIDYLNTNSIVSDIFRTPNGLIIKYETGSFDVDYENQVIKNGTRKINFSYYSRDDKVKEEYKTYIIDPDFKVYDNYHNYNDKIFVIKSINTPDSTNHKLLEYIF